ncbi:response regulator transcription factor [Flavobacterium sp.]|uniref:response regulator transcription factor n=1 Tax=Flavobacterium sp. TaxID=239 RepID=UPI00122453AD|nr:response regulator transcription factor [Flavobacterium sp.]RZJ71714.1 MAG: response regulator transcription factor [Flavobacterium sp.]
MTRIAIADDHRLFRKGMASLLGSLEGIEVVLEAENGHSLLQLMQEIPVDILITDLEMPEMDGFAASKIIREKYPDVKILVVSRLTSKEAVFQVMQIGAHGYFSKDSNPDQLQDAIFSIKEKDFYFGRELGPVIREALLWEKKSKKANESGDVSLTRREVEVIRLACKEYNSLEIASKLFINVRTVETHRKKIMEKTGAKNFIGVVLYALRNDLVGLEEI